MARNRTKPTQVASQRRTPGIAWIAAIISIHVVLGFLYWSTTPFGGAPDENAHGNYLRVLMTSHAFPKYDPASADGYEFYQPPLYYIAAAPFYIAGRAAGMPNPEEAARLLSILLGAISIFLIYGTLRKLLPDDHLPPLLCAGFVALLPTHVMMSSTVSNDVLMEVIFNAAFLLIAGMLIDGATWRRSILLGIVLGLGILTKTTCLALIPIAGLAYFLMDRDGKTAPKSAAARFGGAMLVAFLLSSVWLVRNTILYKDSFAISQMQQSFAAHSPNPLDWFRQGMPASTYLWMVVSWTFKSFWGVFGYMNLFMPEWLYGLLAIVSIAASIGALTALRRSAMNQSARIVLFSALALILIAFLKLNVMVFQSQGRYLYPALLPISYLWVVGIRKFSRDNDVVACIIVASIAVITQIAALTTIFNAV
jgi:4-amino-4-deoxy-L-arabinose transferase-like glycosyltransferase